MGGKRVGQLLRAPARHQPPGDVRHRAEHERERGRWASIERQHAVRRDAREQRARLRPRECAPRELFRRLQRFQAEPRERERMVWDGQRSEHGPLDVRPCLHNRSDHAAICRAVSLQPDAPAPSSPSSNSEDFWQSRGHSAEAGTEDAPEDNPDQQT